MNEKNGQINQRHILVGMWIFRNASASGFSPGPAKWKQLLYQLLSVMAWLKLMTRSGSSHDFSELSHIKKGYCKNLTRVMPFTEWLDHSYTE